MPARARVVSCQLLLTVGSVSLLDDWVCSCLDGRSAGSHASGVFDYRAPEATIVLIEHHGLAWRDRPLGLIEDDANLIVVYLHQAGLIGLAIAHLGATAEFALYRLAIYPVRLGGDQRIAEQQRVVTALYRDQHIALQVL